MFLTEEPPTPGRGALGVEGHMEGFRIGYSYGNSVLTSAKQNLQGGAMHPNVVEVYLQTEIQ